MNFLRLWEKYNVPLWQKRIIRMWLVILLPIGIFFTYQAYTSHQKSLEMQTKGEDELHYPFSIDDTDMDSVRILSSNPDYPHEAKEAFQLRDKYKNKRNTYAIISLILLPFPAITWILAKIYRFIMFGTEKLNNSFIKWFKYALCLALLVLAIAVLYPFVVKKKEEAPAPLPVPPNIKSKGLEKLIDEEEKRKLIEEFHKLK